MCCKGGGGGAGTPQPLSPSQHPEQDVQMAACSSASNTAPAVFLVFVSLLLDFSCQIPVSFRTDVAGGNLSAIAFLQLAPLLLHVLGHKGGGGSLVDLSVIKGVYGSDGLVQNSYMRVTQFLGCQDGNALGAAGVGSRKRKTQS